MNGTKKFRIPGGYAICREVQGFDGERGWLCVGLEMDDKDDAQQAEGCDAPIVVEANGKP